MITHWYNAGVRVISGQGRGQWASVQDIPDQHYRKLFIDFTKQQLDLINGYQMGSDLLNEIAASGHRVTIYLDAGSGGGSATFAETNDALSIWDRFFKPFRPFRAEMANYMRGHLGTLPAWKLSQPDTYYLYEFKKILERCPYSRGMVGKLIGKTQIEIDQMVEGTRPMDDLTYERLAVTLYEWLTPGNGINTCVRWDIGGQQCADAENAKSDWKNDLPFVQLAHELIHAWRMMTGRRIFERGLGEEFMTTGLPPFTALKFTENKLRVQANIAVRDYYNTQSGRDYWDSMAAPWRARSTDAKKWAAR
ncbi:MAG: hypothetical protein KC729_07735 [Candidatus Eisenbacteria bacterium]|uniref:NleD-like pathogen effector protein (Putative zinc metallopeptidase) n=1 Tax=Eiseniibacteriota bacterium TaxID=2212470 RepID=A0A956RNX4_UNCEI|nr:hypothetical protein [Candidatus Eisenbacteria bacterium]